MLQLVIGNKNYSSWSMRPWVLMRELGIGFDEIRLRFTAGPDSAFYRELARYTPAGRVPVLLVDGDPVWDTLAIIEALADLYPALAIWPRDVRRRARARSLAAEMHAGFPALRNQFSMNIEASLPDIGARLLASDADAGRELARIDAMWSEQMASSGGPFLFGAFGAVDAYFSPVVSRMRTYALPLSAPARAYADRVWAAAGVKAWVAEAVAERDFLDFEEPYRKGRG